MSLTTAPRCRPLIRGAAVGLVVLASGLLGAPAASAAPDDGRPVIALDPPDVAMFLIPQENGGMEGFGEALSSAVGDDTAAAEALAEAAAAMPPAVASALGAQAGIGTQTHGEEGAVHVLYGGAIDLQLPALVDSSSATFTLDVYPPDPNDLPRRYRTNPLPSDQPLTVTPLGGNQFTVTLPAQVNPYGPDASLTVDGLTDVDTGAELVFPLYYSLEFTASAPASVSLQPTVGVFSDATCSIQAMESCPGPTVQVGKPVDLTVPAGSLLTTLGFGRLDTAFYALSPTDDEEPWTAYDSETNPELVTVHGPARATLHVPADARPAPYFGVVAQVDPSIGMAITFYEIDVAGVPVNPGLVSDTGWVEEVREVSPASTAAVAGGALLLVGGLVTAVAVRPARRPPLGG